MKNVYLRLFTIFVLSASLLSCDLPRRDGTSAQNGNSLLANILLSQAESRNVWQHMANNFTMHSYHKHPRVQRYIKLYSREDALHLVKFSKQASPYLYHIVDMLEQSDLPHELALLPIVESEYKPQATSRVGAAGLWQLAPATGRIFGLRNDSWYDGRRDVDEATRAALGHLKSLYIEFNNDWLLALAAYNAGGTRVNNAIKANKRAGKPTDYWSLSLPTETQHFVPKFLALVYLIQNAQDLNIELEHIPHTPYFAKVELPNQIDLNHAARLAGLNLTEVKQLNPALRAQVTHPNGPHHIHLPVKNIATFKANYANDKAKTKAVAVVKKSDGKYHTVSKGDTLALIASRYSTTVKSLMSKNQLKSDIIRSGQKLAI